MGTIQEELKKVGLARSVQKYKDELYAKTATSDMLERNSSIKSTIKSRNGKGIWLVKQSKTQKGVIMVSKGADNKSLVFLTLKSLYVFDQVTCKEVCNFVGKERGKFVLRLEK